MPYLAFEARRSVVLPQPAKDASQGVGFFRFGLIGVWAGVDRFVKVSNLGRTESARRCGPGLGDESLCDLVQIVSCAEAEELGAENLGECGPRAFGFGRDSSF